MIYRWVSPAQFDILFLCEISPHIHRGIARSVHAGAGAVGAGGGMGEDAGELLAGARVETRNHRDFRRKASVRDVQDSGRDAKAGQ